MTISHHHLAKFTGVLGVGIMMYFFLAPFNTVDDALDIDDGFVGGTGGYRSGTVTSGSSSSNNPPACCSCPSQVRVQSLLTLGRGLDL